MTDAEFREQRELDTEARFDHADRKAQEYARDGNRLANFHAAAEEVGIPPEVDLLTHARKHWRAICTVGRRLNAGESLEEIRADSTEPLESRIHDLQNYLDLLLQMLRERTEAVQETWKEPEQDMRRERQQMAGHLIGSVPTCVGESINQQSRRLLRFLFLFLAP